MTAVAQLTVLCPYLPVRDIGVGTRFYQETLGFVISYREGNAFVLLKRDGLELALCQKADAFSPSSCLLRVTRIEVWYERCVATGAAITSPLSAKPWGMKMFIVKDPDGNLLDLGESL